MSRALRMAWASQRKPLTSVSSTSRMVPMPSGGGVGAVEGGEAVGGGCALWRGNKAEAQGQPSGKEAGGDGDGAEVYEVDEGGVMGEVGVELDGRFVDFGNAVGCADGGKHEEVNFFPLLGGGLDERFEM